MRIIEQKMIDFIDKKLASNGAAQLAIQNKDARSLLIYAAEACVGIREAGGNNRGPMVELIQETIGKAEREGWCMSFVQTMVAYVEVKLKIKSPLFPTEHCMTAWNNTPKSQRVKIQPLPGAIAVWKKGNSQSGHTGFMTEWRGKTFEAVEGNTESGVNGSEVVRDGGGVYLTNRNSTGTGTMKLVGFLKPF